MKSSLPRRQIVTGYLVSATLHFGLLVLAVVASIPAWPSLDVSPLTVRTVISDRSRTDEVECLSEPGKRIVSPPEAEEQPQSVHDVQVDRSPTSADPGIAEFARRRFDFARREAEEQSPEQQRADLETLGRRLQDVGSEESVAELSGTLNRWLGAEARAVDSRSRTKNSTAPFDAKTAQISDVKKIDSEAGVTYIAVLVDAAGQSTEVELDVIDGAQLYETFQLIKRFPLMEMVYRRTVMGLLDKLTAEAIPPDDSPAPTATETNADSE